MTALDISELPVRKITIFGYSLVVPKETLCIIRYHYDFNVYTIEKPRTKRWASADISIIVVLRHSFFEGGVREVSQIWTRDSRKSKCLRKLFTVSVMKDLKKNDSSDKHWFLHKNVEYKEYRKAMKEPEIRDLILDMFLKGDVTFNEVNNLLPV